MSKVTIEECQRISISEVELQSYDPSVIEVNDQTVKITKTRCNLGGWRYWFVCPMCNRRIGMLYRKPLGSSFLCRHCQNLTYQLTKYRRSHQEVFMKATHKLRESQHN